MKWLFYFYNPKLAIQKMDKEDLSWTLPVILTLSIVVFKFCVQCIFNVEIERDLLASLSISVTDVEIDQIRASFKINIITSVITSFAPMTILVLATAFLSGWAMVFDGCVCFRRLLYWNSIALLPVLFQSLLVLVYLLVVVGNGSLSFSPPFYIRDNIEDIQQYVLFIQESSEIKRINIVSHIAEAASLFYATFNFIYTQKVKALAAVVGMLFFVAIICLAQMVHL